MLPELLPAIPCSLLHMHIYLCRLTGSDTAHQFLLAQSLAWMPRQACRVWSNRLMQMFGAPEVA